MDTTLWVVGFVLLVHGDAVSSLVKSQPPNPAWSSMEDCRRECDGIPKKCYMKLVLERFMVLGPACGNCTKGILQDCYNEGCITADGFKRSILTVNRKLPGPPLEICLNDEMIVDVENLLGDEVTSMHWHGIRQIGSQYADGTAYVTQCPIIPSTTHRYRFTPNIPGSYWYHSHIGVQKLDGLSGPLIIRNVKSQDHHGDLYDEDLSEHVIYIKDWTHVPGEDMVTGLHSKKVSQLPDSLLINGRSNHYKEDGRVKLPLAEFVVEKGKRYRFRIIGATCMTCAIIVRFEGHRVTAITADGGLAFQPTVVDSIFLNPGERFDVILNANNTEGIYHITFETVGPSCKPIVQTAILRYENSNLQESLREKPVVVSNDYGVELNNISSRCDGTPESNICIDELVGMMGDAPKIESPDLYYQLDLNLDLRVLSLEDITQEGKYTPYDEPFKGSYQTFLINNVTFVLPPAPPFTQPDDVPSSAFCSEDCRNGNSTTPCSCILVYSFKRDAVVDFILIGGDITFAHPFHFHGYNLYVMELGTFKNKEKELKDLKERLRNDRINTSLRPMKETINVPVQGYAAVRIATDNPGLWIFHCHFAYHLGGGMAAILKVGDSKDVAPIPKGYPTCGNYLPDDS